MPRAARLAEAENQADVIAGLDLSAEPKDVAGILIDLARRETKTFSVQFAQGLSRRNENVSPAAPEPAEVGELSSCSRRRMCHPSWSSSAL